MDGLRAEWGGEPIERMWGCRLDLDLRKAPEFGAFCFGGKKVLHPGVGAEFRNLLWAATVYFATWIFCGDNSAGLLGIEFHLEGGKPKLSPWTFLESMPHSCKQTSDR